MITTEEIFSRQRELAEIRLADSVYRDILARLKQRQEYEQRWFWELLQNAIDSVEDNDKVDVIVEATTNSISFLHTGDPFDLDDILSLILQGSSKAKKKKVGRFGTGFMTTYLLSKEVKITGKLMDEGGSFSFLLNRNASGNDEFLRLQTESTKELGRSIRPESYMGDDAFQTKFEYTLDEQSRPTAAIGLQSLDELVPVTIIFNSQFSSIEVRTDGRNRVYRKKFLENIQVHEKLIESWLLETFVNGIIERTLKAYILKDSDRAETSKFDVCLITTEREDVEEILSLDDKCPRLYFTFPLIGTEEIGIPFVINSTKFDPRIERDGVYLKATKVEGREDVVNEETNRDIIENAINDGTKHFAELVRIKKIGNAYKLCSYKPSKFYTWMDDTWFNDVKIEVIEALSSIPLVTENKTRGMVPLNSVRIPYADKENQNLSIWKISSSIAEYSIPIYDETLSWLSVVENLSKLRKEEKESNVLIFGLKELIEYVENKVDLIQLVEKLDIAVEKWLQEFYAYILQSTNSFPLNKRILLNQKGTYRCAEGMVWDNCRDEELVKISALLNLDFAETFISTSFPPFSIVGVKSISQDEAVVKIKNRLNELNDLTIIQASFQQANARFLKWIIEKDLGDIIKDLKILPGITREDSKINYEILPKGKHLLLAPKCFFQKAFPYYCNIIRDKDCLNSIYDSFLGEKEYAYLAKNGFIHESPLVLRTEKVDQKTIELLIANEDDLELLKDEDGKIKHAVELTYSDYAYLTTSTGHIYDRNDTPTSSAERFKFLLLEAPEKDTFFETDLQDVRIANISKPIYFHQLLWLYRARGLQWINIKNEEENTFKSETPSSKNLSMLIKDEPILIQAIRGDRQQSFLMRLGVGVSDLIRYTLKSKELRTSWDRAITNIITSNANPELAVEIFNDPNIIKEYEKRLNQKKLIHRNQKIGGLIESIFVEFIIKAKQQGVDVNIKREPRGSDYLLSDESSDWVNENNERVGLKINNWLIELKATGRNYAAMTPLQAKTASNPEINYALVVVPLDGSEPDLDYVMMNAKVIVSIGKKVFDIVDDFENVELKKVDLANRKDGVSVFFDDQNAKFKIEAEIWDSEGQLLETFMQNAFPL